MSEREFVYTEVENRWATPSDRISILRLMWRVSAERDVDSVSRRRVRWMTVRYYVFNPFARASQYVFSK